MGRSLPKQVGVFALISVLALGLACKEKEQLEREAPALARADLKVDRIAVAGVVSHVPALTDSAECRERWSLLLGNEFGRYRFGKLPIVSYSEVGTILGQGDHAMLLDRYRDEGGCDSLILAELHMALEDKARFIVFGSIQQDQTDRTESEVENETTKSKTRTMKTTRIVEVRLRFYDLANEQLAWDYVTVGQASESKDHDMSDIVEHGKDEGFFGGLLTSVVNSILKPDPKFPPAPELEEPLVVAFDNVGVFLKPKKKK